MNDTKEGENTEVEGLTGDGSREGRGEGRGGNWDNPNEKRQLLMASIIWDRVLKMVELQPHQVRKQMRPCDKD